jgi:hypothetical protein
MRFRSKVKTAVLACMLLGSVSSALAQQKGQWVPGPVWSQCRCDSRARHHLCQPGAQLLLQPIE